MECLKVFFDVPFSSYKEIRARTLLSMAYGELSEEIALDALHMVTDAKIGLVCTEYIAKALRELQSDKIRRCLKEEFDVDDEEGFLAFTTSPS